MCCILDSFNAVVVIPANKNICKNQLVWMRMGFCIFIAKPSQKQLHALQCGENICSCVNVKLLNVVHKEEHRDMGRNLSCKCEERLIWMASLLCGNPQKRVPSLVNGVGSNAFVSTPDRTGCLAYSKRGWWIAWWLFRVLAYQISSRLSFGKI